jgi:hypothetical protein
MSPVVQARCPHCQNVLRIPSEWIDQAMRCKHCKNTFQAKPKPATAAPANVAAGLPQMKAGIPVGKPAYPKSIPTAVAAGAPPMGAVPLSFGADESGGSPSVRRRGKGRGLMLLVVMFFFLFLLGAGAAVVVVHKALNDSGDLKDLKQFVKGDTDKGGERNPIRTPGNDTPREPKQKTSAAEEKDKSIEEKKSTPVVDPPPKKPKQKKTPPPKTDPTPPDNEKKEVKKEGPKTPSGPEYFPRRALLISVNNYLFYNTVHYGSEVNAFFNGYPGSSTAVLRDRLTRPPMNFPATQVVELSDGIPAGKATKAHSTQRSVIETTIQDFLAGSRAQDRIVIVFAGHAASVGDKSYLVPVDGNLKELDTLVPLQWVYDQMAACKAQQKILILDAFRYSPARGSDLGVTGEGDEGKLPEAFDKDLDNPPAGVQVWSSCSKEQSSIELEGGSAFLQALCNALQGGGAIKGISSPMQPIPIDAVVKDVNDRLKMLADAEKRTQVSRLTGKAPENMVAYNRDEALPDLLTIKPPKAAAGAEFASKTEMKSILDFFENMAPVRESRSGDQNLFKADRFPPFRKSKLESYKSDSDKDFTDLMNQYKTDKPAYAKEFPMRAAVFDALDAMQESTKVQVREVIRKDENTPKGKEAILQAQQPVGQSIFKLEQALIRLKAAGEKEKREAETSRRWQANYDYTLARLQSRLVFLIEYSYTLAAMRRDDLPELAPGQNGWRLGTGKKITVNEKKAKDLVADLVGKKGNKGLWDTIQENYPETPWALLATREKGIALGLEWRPKSD